nr:hypothetical protein [Tanacetum cinerariifolium]
MTFTLVENACPITRLTATNKVPLRVPIPLEVVAPKHVVTRVYTRRPKVPKSVQNSKPKVAKSMTANRMEPGTSRGLRYFSCSIFFFSYRLQVVQIVLWYLDFGCSKHMTGDRSQLTNFVHKFLGTVKFGNDQVAKIIRYGDYQIRSITISRFYYVEGLGHNLFSELSIGNMMGSSPICLLSKATKTKSWLWHRHLNFSAINHLARHGLVRGLPRLKFEKDHLCSACAMGKSKN